METLRKLLFLFSIKELKRARLLLLMTIIMSLIDIIGVASIMPFIAVLTNPSLIESNLILSAMYEQSTTFGVKNNQQFLFFLGILFFLLLIISLVFKALTTFVQIRLIYMLEYNISKRLVEGYLHQPYEWFLDNHSAKIAKSIFSELGQIIGYGMSPMLELITKVIVATSLIVLLIFTDPKLALIVAFTFGSIYALIYAFTHSFLDRIGRERLRVNQLRFRSVNDPLDAFKEVKVGGLEKTFTKQFSNSAKLFAQHQGNAQIISQLPRFAVEALIFGGMLLAILYLMLKSGGFVPAMPVIALYIFAGYRLMPAIQKIYSSISQLRVAIPALDDVYNDLKNLKPINLNQYQTDIELKKKITLNKISYNYPNTTRTALKDIDIDINFQTTVGFVGATGSGKTSLVDIILGLLEAQKGTLEVDGQAISKKNHRSWQSLIGYVPQKINLVDDTISANIAFGTDFKDIDQKDVENASKIANLHDFITNELPNQYQTIIGEDGIKLSGGQRQRIGIARALYHKPKILILDEATSALDNTTEKGVMDAIRSINKELTVILIAHRLSTVKKCDNIFLLENGEIKNQGSFYELVKISESFRNMSIKENLII
tara:strand:- start:37072 stop:38877 length:1806 start_codon:yes stop_codon:yes gene_type:complete